MGTSPGRGRRRALAAVTCGFMIMLAAVLPLQEAGAEESTCATPGTCAPPPVINIGAQPAQYTTALQTFENNAVNEVLAEHNLPASDYNRVLGWARGDVRAQEWYDLNTIANADPSTLSSTDQMVLQWWNSLYQQEQVSEAQDAINEFQKWSGLSISDASHVPDSTAYCNYTPPGGSSGPFAGSYSVADVQQCSAPCTDVFGCQAPYPSLAQFQAWGAYDELGSEVDTPDFVGLSTEAGASAAIGSVMVAGGIATAATIGASLAAGGSGLAASVVTSLGFAVDFIQLGATTAASTAAAANAVVVGSALAAGSIAAIVGVALLFVAVTATAIVELVQNAAIPVDLECALTEAQTGNPTPGSCPNVEPPSSDSSKWFTFLAATMPDVDYTCSTASTDPCAEAPAIPGPEGSDPQFLISTTNPNTGVTTTSPSSSIYTVDPLYTDSDGPDVYQNTRLSGNGWFVSTGYAASDSANLQEPTDAQGTFQSTQLFYKDWQGNDWVAERVEDSSGNPTFALAPLTTGGSDPCAQGAPGTNPSCITNTLDIQTPNGTDETVEVVPASALQPTISANVPPVVDTGVTTSYSATGTDPNDLPLTYTWDFVCPGSSLSQEIFVDCFNGGSAGYVSATGATAVESLPTPGAYTVEVTAKDTDGYSASSSFTVNSVAPTTTTVYSALTSPTTFGQTETFTADVDSSGCDCVFSEIPLMPAGDVQFYLNGSPVGAPVPVSTVAPDGVPLAGEATAASIPMVLPTGSDVVSAQYVTSGAVDALGGPPPFQPGFFGSEGSTTVQVNETAPVISMTSNYTGFGTGAVPVFGEPVSFSTTVSAPSGESGTPTGLVQFYVDGNAFGSPVELNGTGQATSITTSALSVKGLPGFDGTGHSIGVVYVGDQNYQFAEGPTGAFGANDLAIVAAGTTTSLVTSLDSSVPGQPVTLTATVSSVSPSTATPSGDVAFLDGSTAIGGCSAVALSGGSATCTTTTLGVGSHVLTASFAANTDFTTSTSGSQTVAVAKNATRTVLTSSTSPTMHGTSVTFTAKVAVSAPGVGTPTGSVTFADGSATIGTGTLHTAGGVTSTTLTTSALPAGAQSITATYGGDAQDMVSSSLPITQLVDTSLSTYPKLKDGAYNLGKAKLTGAYLSDLNLAGASLAQGEFKSANFTNTNLSGAAMNLADFTSANFTGANLTDANLTLGTFKDAVFTDANLTGSNLGHADLQGAIGLKTATLTGATWFNTECPDGTMSNKDGGSCLAHL